MTSAAPIPEFQLAGYENRPFFEKALRYGMQHKLLGSDKLVAINAEAPKGIVQIATAFGSPYLRDEIELARQRIVNLVSLYLSETAQGDLEKAARLIRDNTFLTLSRGGSTLLKELFALPEYPILGKYDNGRVEDFLEFWSLKKNHDDYRNARQQRTQYQLEIRLAKKLGTALGLKEALYQDQHCEADALIRTAILIKMGSAKNALAQEAIDQIGFAELLNKLRKKASLKAVTLDGTFSSEELALISRLQQDILTHDLPPIADADIPLDQLIHQIKGRYFIREHDMEDSASYDALVSKEWSKHTKGKSDIDAIFTLLLCIAAGLPSKVSLTEAGAKTLVKKLRKDGFAPKLASEFIRQHAPHEKQESLLEDWEEFCEQALLYLMDDWDHDLHLAMKFLHDNCYIENKANKSVKQKAHS